MANKKTARKAARLPPELSSHANVTALQLDASMPRPSVNSLSDNLRIELAPLGVSVVAVMVGSITTPFYANGASFELPPKSRYMAFKETIARWAR
ncbi:hypothetical protein C8F04DRAFT_1272638 [Mycena alexandri]|uniref:Uncharacterized protein n=1 Tax=Mycena alexandri TaxID=1745969 RepID=A0AAD6S724_9AGAR|nr:hypothetical protein C8F04DRAFT_1272638 [Mycena alexandri]